MEKDTSPISQALHHRAFRVLQTAIQTDTTRFTFDEMNDLFITLEKMEGLISDYKKKIGSALIQCADAAEREAKTKLDTIKTIREKANASQSPPPLKPTAPKISWANLCDDRPPAPEKKIETIPVIISLPPQSQFRVSVEDHETNGLVARMFYGDKQVGMIMGALDIHADQSGKQTPCLFIGNLMECGRGRACEYYLHTHTPLAVSGVEMRHSLHFFLWNHHNTNYIKGPKRDVSPRTILIVMHAIRHAFPDVKMFTRLTFANVNQPPNLFRDINDYFEQQRNFSPQPIAMALFGHLALHYSK